MSDPKQVDPNTDNLEDFSELYFGKAKELTEQAEPVEEPTEEPTEKDVEETDPLADDNETEQEDQEDSEEESKVEDKPRRNRYQERINELVTRAREAEEGRKALEKKLDEFIAKQTQPQTPEVVEDSTPRHDELLPDGTPKYPLGEFDPQFIRDLTADTIKKETLKIRAEENRRAEESRQQAEQEQLISSWNQKLQVAQQELPDWAETTSRLQSEFQNIDPAFGEYIASAIMSMDNGTEVLHYLGKNIEEARQIVASGPVKATIALGRLEAKLAAPAPAPQTKVTRAPEPPPMRTKGGAPVATQVAPDTDDLEAFEDLFFSKR